MIDDATRQAQTTALVAELCAEQRIQWRQGTPIRIEAYFELHPQLLASPEAAVDLIYHEFLLRRSTGDSVNPAEYITRFPILAEKLGRQFEVDEFLESPGNQLVAGDLRRLGRFELLQRVGAGTSGVVWKGYDTLLQRYVAIKIPHAGQLADDREQARFLREGRSASQLRHPGIVTFLEAGVADEIPYLVTDFIDGTTLALWLQHESLNFVQAARLVAQVADALSYAHAMGIIHRDVKPSNVMLEFETEASEAATPHKATCSLPGKPRLMDFSLARQRESLGTVTAQGHLLGTPFYMSPEQAAGRNREVDARSDLYSLGVVLYELLTGRVPFLGVSHQVLHQVINSNPIPPRRLNRDIPLDLETICLKAIAKEPAVRYGSAREFADDLQRFLTGEPIRARPVNPAERIWRWARRNPRIAGLVGAVVTLAVLVALLATISESRIRAALSVALYERSRAEKSLVQASRDRKRAAESFADARGAVDDFFLRVSQDALLNAPGLQPLRRSLLARANQYHRRFVEREGGNSQLQAELGQSNYALAVINHELGDLASARRYIDEAIEIGQRLCDRDPSSARAMVNQANSYIELGKLQSNLERHGLALTAFQQAERRAVPLVERDPDSIDCLALNAHCDSLIAITLNRLRRHGEAKAQFERACALQEQVLAKDRASADAELNLGWFLINAGANLDSMDRRQAALETGQKAQSVLERYTKRHPTVLAGQMQLAWCYEFLAGIHAQSGGHDAGLNWALRSFEIRNRLAQENPSVVEYQSNLASACRLVAKYQTKLEDFIKWHGRGQEISESIVQRHIGGFADPLNLASGYAIHAGVLRHAGDLPSAISLLTKAHVIWRQIESQQIESPEISQQHADALSALALCHYRAGNRNSYSDACTQLIAHCQKWSCRNHDFLLPCLLDPDLPLDFNSVANAAEALARGRSAGPDRVATLGGALFRANRHSEAIAVLHRADGQYRLMLRAAAGHPVVIHAGHARAQLWMALTQRHLGHLDESRRWFRAACESLDAAGVSIASSAPLALASPWVPNQLDVNRLISLWDCQTVLRTLTDEFAR